MITKEQGKEIIRKLVETFRDNLQQYSQVSYKEAHVRKEFIDKLFVAFGWDVNNEEGLSERYKEVISEDAIKIGGKTKAPDYGFRIGGVRKFFVEAKKPSIKIKEEAEPAFQLRHYAWNAKLPLSILTDFEEFAIYDCTTKPSEKDKASVGRIMYLTFEEYLSKFDDIWNIFSKECVWKGSFDRFIESSKGKKGTAEVDDEFLKEIQQIVRVLGISSADMEKGSMRLEANISVKPSEQSDLPGYKVEIKNVNSFRFIKKAVDFEVARQINILQSGQTPSQETRGYSERLGETYSQRTKEEAHDYRYFPEPDIPPLVFTQKQIDNWKSELPPLPGQLRNVLINKYALSPANAAIISANKDMHTIYTQAVGKSDISPKILADFLINKRYGELLPATPSQLIQLIKSSQAQSSVSSDQIRKSVTRVLDTHPRAVADLKTGKQQAMFFIIGQIKRELGNIDIELTKNIIGELLKINRLQT